MPEVAVASRELTLGEAIREALAEELRRDSRVFILGEDIAEPGHPFKVLTGLRSEVGAGRILDTPISEAGFCPVPAVAPTTSMRPRVEIMVGAFFTFTV